MCSRHATGVELLLFERVDDAIAARAPGIWFQLDCIHEEAAQKAAAAGMAVVMDRCIMVEHARLLGRGSVLVS